MKSTIKREKNSINTPLKDILKISKEIEKINKIKIQGKEFDLRKVDIIVNPATKAAFDLENTGINIFSSRHIARDKVLIMNKKSYLYDRLLKEGYYE